MSIHKQQRMGGAPKAMRGNKHAESGRSSVRFERRLTAASLTSLNQTRDRVLHGRRFALTSGQILRELREGSAFRTDLEAPSRSAAQ